MSSTELPTPPHPRFTVDGNKLFSEERSAEVVAASFADTPDPRLRQVLTALTRHLHAFVKEVELTEEEWGAAVDFLTRTGQKCDDVRQEFILLSDVLGVSMLVETINHRTGGTSTESTVLGPFHMVESPAAGSGRRTSRWTARASPAWSPGRVTGPDGEPLAGALVDVWQANADGFYDVQQPDVQPERNLRGLFTADDDGRFWFRTIVPRYYPIPDDGPVGELLTATGRHPYRPAHVHFIVTAPGYRPVTTHLFVDDSPVPGLRRRLRGEGEPGPGRSRCRRPGARRRGRVAQPVPHGPLRHRPARAARRADAGRPTCSPPWSGAPEGAVIRPFTYQALPMRVTFGIGALRRLPDEVAALGLTRVLVLCSPEQEATGKLVAEALGDRAAGVLPEARMHVPVEVAHRARALATELGADGCVAVGGGSAIGLGKAIALEHGLPVIAVPTTYAGSEMTPIWGLTDGGAKRTGRDPRVLPASVLYDPDLTLTLPAGLSATSGMNAIAHAVEGLYAPDASPIISLMAEEGVRALATALPRVVADGADIDARADAQYGAWLCGAVLGATTMSLHHKLCHTLGGTLDLPHAPTHTVVLPHALAYNAPAAPQAVAALTRALGGAADPARDLWDLAGRLGAPRSLARARHDRGRHPPHRRPRRRQPLRQPAPGHPHGLELLPRAAWAGDQPT